MYHYLIELLLIYINEHPNPKYKYMSEYLEDFYEYVKENDIKL